MCACLKHETCYDSRHVGMTETKIRCESRHIDMTETETCYDSRHVRMTEA